MVEADIIAQLAKRFPSKEAASGIGDDAVLLNGLLISQDLLLEGVHFSLDYFSPEALAHKALHANLSDIAAMGGTPKNIMLGLSVPVRCAQDDSEWVHRFLEKLCDLCEQHSIKIIGGDTTQSAHDLVINITIFGEPGERILTRSGAKPGDKICVTGFLGESNAGLKVFQQAILGFDGLKNKHCYPEARIQEGQWFAQQQGVTATMDLSDGLFLDLPKLCAASQCGARVNLECLPVSDEMKNFANALGEDATEIALEGGEDYELLLTIDSAQYASIQQAYQKVFQTPLTCIGEVLDDQSMYYFSENIAIKPNVHPFTHED